MLESRTNVSVYHCDAVKNIHGLCALVVLIMGSVECKSSVRQFGYYYEQVFIFKNQGYLTSESQVEGLNHLESARWLLYLLCLSSQHIGHDLPSM